jgi:chromate transport protein ChrA
VSGGSAPSPRPPSRPASGSRERLRSFGHYLTAAVLALKGYSKLENPEGHRALIGVCFASALIIVVVTALHSRLHHHAAKIEALVYVLEAAVAGTMAVVMAEEGKRGLPFMWAIAAAGFLAGAAVRWRGGMRPDEAARGER